MTMLTVIVHLSDGDVPVSRDPLLLVGPNINSAVQEDVEGGQVADV